MLQCFKDKISDLYNSPYGGFERSMKEFEALKRAGPPKPIEKPYLGTSGKDYLGKDYLGTPKQSRPGYPALHPSILKRPNNLNPRLSSVEAQEAAEDDRDPSA